MRESKWFDQFSKKVGVALLSIVVYSLLLAFIFQWMVQLPSQQTIGQLSVVISIFLTPMYLLGVLPLSLMIEKRARRKKCSRRKRAFAYTIAGVLIGLIAIVFLMLKNNSEATIWSSSFTIALTVLGSLIYWLIYNAFERIGGEQKEQKG